MTDPALTEMDVNDIRCADCGTQVFLSKHKFNSGTGWPSFTEAVPSGVTLNVSLKDRILQQAEVNCAKCNGHLGHVFKDGPQPPNFNRFCINGVALTFEPS